MIISTSCPSLALPFAPLYNNDQMCDQLDREALQTKASINKNLHLLNRHEQIRARHWLDKLGLPTNNHIWKQNRNLYLKVLQQMVVQSTLMKPFNQSPPEGPLPKLTIYEVPYPIRIRLPNHEPRTETRPTSRNRSPCQTRKNSMANLIQDARSVSTQGRDMQYRKKIDFNERGETTELSQNTCKIRFNSEQFRHSVSGCDSQSRCTSREKTSTQKLQHCDKSRSKNNVEKTGCQLLAKILKFLGEHYEQFEDSIMYGQLMERIVQAGDRCGHDFRQVTLSNVEESLEMERCSQRIKSKLFQTDLNNMEFMSYLNSL